MPSTLQPMQFTYLNLALTLKQLLTLKFHHLVYSSFILFIYLLGPKLEASPWRAYKNVL